MRFDRSITFVHERRMFRLAGFGIPNPNRVRAYSRQDKMSVLTEFRRVDRTARAPDLKAVGRILNNCRASVWCHSQNPRAEFVREWEQLPLRPERPETHDAIRAGGQQ